MMPVKNKTIEDYVLGRCNAQQMNELAVWACACKERALWLFGLRDAFLNIKFQHAFDHQTILDAAEERLFKAIAEGQQ